MTGAVENGSEKSRKVAFIATGYDSKNKVVETKTVNSYILSGAMSNYSVTLNKGDEIVKVVMKTKAVD